MSDTAPEPDRIEGAPHPRDTLTLLGQDQAEAAFLEAFNTGRMHHGWLISGPRGVGKATLAWRIARFLLAQPAAGGGLFGDAPPAAKTLDIPAGHPVTHRIRAQSEPGLFVLRRALDEKKGTLKSVITVDEVRRLKNFFALSATDGGRRVVIVDAADEMNVNAANALLKLLEEPPANATLLLVAHQPSRLLPTIRSRCRALRCVPLGQDQMQAALQAAGVDADAAPPALAALSGGAVGAAVRLTNLDGLGLYADLIALLQDLPQLDRPRTLKLAESVSGKTAEPRFDLLLTLLDIFYARLARTGVAGPPLPEAAKGEAALLSRLSPDPYAARIWAETADTLSARGRHGKAVHLDPTALILDTVLRIDEAAKRLSSRQTSA